MADARENSNQLVRELESARRRIADLEGRLAESERITHELSVLATRHQILLDGSRDMLVLLELSNGRPGRMIEANAETIRRLGYTEEELDEINVQELIDPKTWQKIPDYYERLQADGIFADDITMYGADGSQMPCHLRVHLLDLNDAQGVFIVLQDTSERVQVEQALRESEARYRAIVEDQTELVCRFRPDGTFTFVNDAYCRYFGTTREELIGSSALLTIPDEETGKVEEFLTTLTPENPVGIQENRVLQGSTGETRWQRWVDRAIFDEAGQVVEYQSVGRDITDMMSTREALRESEQLLERIFNNLQDAVYVVEAGTQRIIRCNPAVKDVFGYDKDDLLGLPVRILGIDDETHLHFAQKLDRAIEESGCLRQFVNRLRRKDGSTFDAEHTVAPLEDQEGRLVGWVSVVRDITKRLQTEEALRESESRYRTLFEADEDATFVLKDSHIVDYNVHTAELFGRSGDELMGKTPYDLSPELQPDGNLSTIAGEKRVQAALAGFPQRFAWKHNRGDGSVFDCEVILNAFELEGEPCLLATVRDITERQQLEREMQKVEKLESLGVLAGGIAHDFNNLLTGILGNIALARLIVDPSSEVQSLLHEAERASLRTKSLTQQLLTFSKGGAPVRTTTSITDLLRDTTRFALHGSDVKAHFHIADDLSPVDVDAGQFSQVIQNLVLNADQAMPQGGAVTVSAENIWLRSSDVLPLPEGAYVLVTVEDDGIGILEEHLDKIFDPYYTTKQKGSGLGLATVYSIVKMHDGHITVESDRGAGASFHIYLPASKKATATEQLPDIEDCAPHVNVVGKILVMDDEPMVRDTAGHMLRYFGHSFDYATDGLEATEKYREAMQAGEPFDVVILDLTIPGGMGGLDTIKALRELDPQVSAIVSSGYSTDPVMAQHEQYGFRGVVTKPYLARDLAAAVQEALRARQAGA